MTAQTALILIDVQLGFDDVRLASDLGCEVFVAADATAGFLGSVSNSASMEKHPTPRPADNSACQMPPLDSPGGPRGVATAASET